jgi:hypothetical protein
MRSTFQNDGSIKAGSGYYAGNGGVGVALTGGVTLTNGHFSSATTASEYGQIAGGNGVGTGNGVMPSMPTAAASSMALARASSAA